MKKNIRYFVQNLSDSHEIIFFNELKSNFRNQQETAFWDMYNKCAYHWIFNSPLIYY